MPLNNRSGNWRAGIIPDRPFAFPGWTADPTGIAAVQTHSSASPPSGGGRRAESRRHLQTGEERPGDAYRTEISTPRCIRHQVRRAGAGCQAGSWVAAIVCTLLPVSVAKEGRPERATARDSDAPFGRKGACGPDASPRSMVGGRAKTQKFQNRWYRSQPLLLPTLFLSFSRISPGISVIRQGSDGREDAHFAVEGRPIHRAPVGP